MDTDKNALTVVPYDLPSNDVVTIDAGVATSAIAELNS